jgi:hypothetical protein
MYHHFSTHDKYITTYKKLTPNLCLLSFFNCIQLLFAMCFFYALDLSIH